MILIRLVFSSSTGSLFPVTGETLFCLAYGTNLSLCPTHYLISGEASSIRTSSLLKRIMAQFSGMGLQVDSPGIDDALLDDFTDQPMDTATMNPGLAELMSQFGTQVQRGETELNDPVWLGRFTEAVALQQSGDGSHPPDSAQETSISRPLAVMQERTTNARLTEMEEAISSIRYASVMDEVSKRDLLLERRERDKGIRMGLFTNKFVKHHAADLFDQQGLMDDLMESAQVLVPEMVSGFSTAASKGLLEGASVNVEGICSLQALSPLIKGLVGARHNLDRQIHFQQMCSSSKVGFEDMRSYLSQDEQMAKHFSGSTADKAAWVLYQKS